MKLKFRARRLKRLNALLVKGRAKRWPKPEPIKIVKPRVVPRWHPVTGDKSTPEIDRMFELAHSIAMRSRQIA